jgi:septum formation protein
VPCTAVSSGFDEAPLKASLRARNASAEEAAAALAEAKARAVARARHQDLVIGADQILDQDGTWFDKPRTMNDARAQLQTLMGRTHRLMSAVVVVSGELLRWRHVEEAKLTMRVFGDDFLDAYLASAGEDILGSVGAYRLEGTGAQLFERIEGDYFTILGLPLLPLLDFLRREGALAR